MKTELRKYGLFWLTIFKEYYAKQYMYHASALTFSSLLSIVPILTICIAILSALPFYNKVIQQVENLILSHFIAASGHNIQSYLRNIVDHALHVSTISLLFLALVALQMIHTLEQALNTIWESTRRRTLLSAIVLYCVLLMSAPLLIATGVMVNSLLVANSFFNYTLLPFKLFKPLLNFTPLILSTLSFTFIYIIVPSCSVPLRHGLQAGFIAAVLFEAAKSSFGFYVKHIADYQIIYGPLAAIPIFLLWIYISWCIVLLGALISKTLTHHAIKLAGR